MSQDVVADVLVKDDSDNVQVDVGDVSEELLDEDVHDVALDEFPHVVGHYQRRGLPDSDSNPHRRGPCGQEQCGYRRRREPTC